MRVERNFNRWKSFHCTNFVPNETRYLKSYRDFLNKSPQVYISYKHRSGCAWRKGRTNLPFRNRRHPQKNPEWIRPFRIFRVYTDLQFFLLALHTEPIRKPLDFVVYLIEVWYDINIRNHMDDSYYERKEFVAREALVIPSITCLPSAGSIPSSSNFALVSS